MSIAEKINIDDNKIKDFQIMLVEVWKSLKKIKIFIGRGFTIADEIFHDFVNNEESLIWLPNVTKGFEWFSVELDTNWVGLGLDKLWQTIFNKLDWKKWTV